MVKHSITLWVPEVMIDRSFAYTSYSQKENYLSLRDAKIPIFPCSLLGPQDTVEKWLRRVEATAMIDRLVVDLTSDFNGYMSAQLSITGSLSVCSFFTLEVVEAVHLKLLWPT